MSKPKINIDVVSDVVCPWCYIGKRRMEKAIAELKDRFDFIVNYSPFELNPDMPAAGVDQKTYLIKKFGGEDRYDQLTKHVTQVAKGEGLSFDYKKQKVSPNSRDAHRVIAFAKKEGKQDAMKESFMKAYFEDGIDLSKSENLIALAEQTGLQREKVKSLLESSEGLSEVASAEEINQQRGVQGVPFYIINDKYGISGAQPSAVFVQTIMEIAGKMN